MSIELARIIVAVLGFTWLVELVMVFRKKKRFPNAGENVLIAMLVPTPLVASGVIPTAGALAVVSVFMTEAGVVLAVAGFFAWPRENRKFYTLVRLVGYTLVSATVFALIQL